MEWLPGICRQETAMGYTYGFIMIKGDHTARFVDILGMFGYEYAGEDMSIDSYDETHEFLGPHMNDWSAIACCKNWTIIIDLEGFKVSETPIIQKLSRELKSPVFTLYTFSHASLDRFSYVDGDRLREYERDGYDVVIDKGVPMACEAIKTDFWPFRLSSIDIMEQVCGISVEDIEKHKGYNLKKFVLL